MAIGGARHYVSERDFLPGGVTKESNFKNLEKWVDWDKACG
jgi:hypothetical protein